MSEPGKKSYGEILKSSAMIGGSAAMVMGFGMVRNKAMAVLLGTAGFGLYGIYLQISELARTLAGLGINSSGVRQIAEAVGSGDRHRIARTVSVLRKVAVYSGAAGAVLLMVFCYPISQAAFGDSKHAVPIALLGFVAFCGDISAGQLALVQGVRRIADLARMNVLGALYGTVFGIAIVYYLKEQGVVPSLMCVAAMGVLTSWWYARKVKVESVQTTTRDVVSEASELVKLGLIFVASGLAVPGSTFLARLMVNRLEGPDAAGLYHAAWSMSGLWIGFIVQAMGTDFYPRLTGVANRNEEVNRLVNEQAEVGLLMAGPGIMGTMTLAPVVMTVFYSNKFSGGSDLLRWFCLGMLLRVVVWPMAFIFLARGEKKIFFWSEILAAAGYVGLVAGGMYFFRLQGVGIAFFIEYVLYTVVVYRIVRGLTGFRWTKANVRLWALYGPLIAAVFIVGRLSFLGKYGALALGITITAACGIYSLVLLCRLVSTDRLPPAARKVLRLLKLVPSKTDANEQNEHSGDRVGLRGTAPVVSVRSERGDGSGPGY